MAQATSDLATGFGVKKAPFDFAPSGTNGASRSSELKFLKFEIAE